MSQGGSNPGRWSIDVYDYESKAITDAGVGKIDLWNGRWVHCKWCNKTVKTSFFSLTTWKNHQKTKTHLMRGQEHQDDGSQPQFVSCSSQTSIDSAASRVRDPQRQDHESLVLVRRDLHLNKQYQARHERDVANVINAMTSLIADQQGDLDALQNQVENMTREIQALKNDVKLLRRKGNQRRDTQPPPKKKVAPKISYACQRNPVKTRISPKNHEIHANGGLYSFKKTYSRGNTNKRSSISDMDLFEKRFRLTGRG